MGEDSGLRVLVTVPAYNEEGSIATVIADIRRHAPSADVLVVNDGSTDRTAEIACGAGALVCTLPCNLGVGGAVQTGFRYAHKHGYDIMLQVDGDGQHPASEIHKVIAAVQTQEADAVIGSRYVGAVTYRAPMVRRVGMRLLSSIAYLTTGQRVTDTTSGFRAYGPQAIRLLAEDYPTHYPEPETIVLMHKHRMRVQEIRVEMRERQAGVSSITWLKSCYYMLRVPLGMLMSSLRRTAA